MEMTELAIGDHDCRFIGDILSRIGDKWTGLVVRSLRERPHRFNELKRAVDGISQQMLTRTLKALERDGVVLRTVHPTVPPQVEYCLTSLGHSLSEPVFRLVQWAWENADEIRRQRDHFDARNNSKFDVL
jgi:DNA-binding HxlR family transcriptional regulator